MNYIIGQLYNSILVIVDKFTKWGYFIVYKKSILTEELLKIYIKEVFLKYKTLAKISQVNNATIKSYIIGLYC